MKILHLIDSGGLYGAEQMLLALTEEQIKQGLQPVILSCGLPDEADKALEIEAEKRNIPVIKWRMKSGLNFKGAWEIIKRAQKEQVDIFHSHGYKFNILFAIFPRFVQKKPFLTTVHGYVHAPKYSASWVYQILDKICLKQMHRVVFVSQQTQKSFLSLKNFNVISNGISTTIQSKIELNERFDGHSIKLLAVGRLAVEKGFEFILQAIYDANMAGKKISVDIMGTGNELDNLQKMVQTLKLNSNVKFLGFIEEPSRYFYAYDALIMPSLTEGLPITLLEALREKLPVLASNVGEIPFVLEEHCPLINVDEDLPFLYKNICEFECFYNTSGEQAQLALYDKFRNEYSSKNMASKYKAVYENM
ncbi:MAG: glycosyltransferase involved in cell wall biosynthesis [bacterium]|jgi:glycosyltransferase involved in cell wall biosynthesis